MQPECVLAPKCALCSVLTNICLSSLCIIAASNERVPERARERRHQFTLYVVHEIFEECIHSRHVLGVGLRIPYSGAIGISVEIAHQEDALVFTLYDTFG